MGEVMEYIAKTKQETPRRPQGWNGAALMESSRNGSSSPLNVRAVEFIARPGKGMELQECLRSKVLEFLKKKNGFAGAVILSAHKESRLIAVLSFWDSQSEATENNWEDSTLVQQALIHLIDVCSKVHTYEAEIPAQPRASNAHAELLAC